MADGGRLIIAISREFGAGGAIIGRRVAEHLGIRYLDRAILEEAARTLGEPEEEVAAFEERTLTFSERFFNAFASGSLEAGLLSVPARYGGEVFRVESEIIRRVAAELDCVIVGRGSVLLAPDGPGLVKVFLHAPLEYRIAQVRIRQPELDPAGIPALVRRSDADRTRFIHTLTDIPWTDARHYHLTIDTGSLGLDRAEEMILIAAELARDRIRNAETGAGWDSGAAS